MWDLGFRVYGIGFGIWALGFEGIEFGVLGFRV